MASKKKPVEAVRGTYSAMPHTVLDSPAYTGASVAAKALLNELIRQHNGANNGRLQLSNKWLATRGWPSKSIVDKARAELIERGLIIQTKQGGMGIGATWHAMTWLPITNHVGLETTPNTYHPGGWQCCDLPPTSRRKPPVKKVSQPDHRDGPAPTTGAASRSPAPTTGSVKPVFGTFPAPTTGHDVLHQSPHADSCRPEAVQQFKARIGGRLTFPARDNILGRTRQIHLFRDAFGHLFTHQPHPATIGQTPVAIDHHV